MHEGKLGGVADVLKQGTLLAFILQIFKHGWICKSDVCGVLHVPAVFNNRCAEPAYTEGDVQVFHRTLT